MSGETALHTIDNADEARQLVESIHLCRQKEFILSVDENGLTALHAAAVHGRTDVVEYLCNLSLADDELILKKSVNGQTALHYAKDREIAKLLVESVLPNNKTTFILSVDDKQGTALLAAAVCDRIDVVEYLCNLAPANDELILKSDVYGQTALHYAENREIAKLLVESVLPNNKTTFILSVDENQHTALHVAANKGRTDVVEYLCNLSPANDELILKRNFKGETALHYAENREIAKLLVESVLPNNYTIFILSVDENQFTALHTAAIYERTRVVEYLCRFSELSVSLMFWQDCFNNTGMHFATNKTIVSCMLSSLEDAQIDELLSLTNNKGNTPILSLVDFGQHESLAELLQHIDNETDLDIITYLEQHNYDGQNILHLAALSLFLDSIYNALQNYVGCLKLEKMMYPDAYGNTPIHYVAAKYDTKVFADFMLHLSLTMRQKITDLPNSQLVDCRNIIHQKNFSELFYIEKVLADDKHSSLVEKFAADYILRKDFKQQLTHPKSFYKYDETILKVLKYCLNEYSLLDSAYTTSHSLFLETVCQQKSGQEDKVS